MTENEPPADPQPQPDLAGYPDQASLVAGYKASSQEGKRQRERADKAEALLREMLANGDAPRQDVPDRRAAPEERLTEFGVPADAVRELVDARVNAVFEPLTRGVQARQRMVERHPHYEKFENEIMQFLRNDPARWRQYSGLYASDPEAALQWGVDTFATHEVNAFSVRQLLGDSPTHASIPTSRSGDGRRAPSQDGAVQEAFERFQKTGSQQDAQAYAKARLKGVISERHLWPDGAP
jgi:hypothetical protein